MAWDPMVAFRGTPSLPLDRLIFGGTRTTSKTESMDTEEIMEIKISIENPGNPGKLRISGRWSLGGGHFYCKYA